MMVHVPMFHCFGMVLAMTAAMTHGATVSAALFFPEAQPCLHKQRADNCFHGVPTMFIARLGTPTLRKRTSAICAPAYWQVPLPHFGDEGRPHKNAHVRNHIVYGQTEASPGCTMSSATTDRGRVATVGRPLPEIECK
jgi:fatty-acyl-CoA synthase